MTALPTLDRLMVAAAGRARLTCPDGYAVTDAPEPGLWTDGGRWRAVQVGYPTQRPEPWAPAVGDDTLCWCRYADDPACPTQTTYRRVPVPLLHALILSHGGEAR